MKILVIHTFDQVKSGDDSVVENEVRLLRSQGVQVELMRIEDHINTLSRVLQMPFNHRCYRKVKQKILSFNPDAVHMHYLDFSSAVGVVFAAKKFKLPLVYTLHNYNLLCPSGTLFYKNSLLTNSLNRHFSWKVIWQGQYYNSRLLTFLLSLSMFIHHLAGTWKGVSRFIVPGEYTRQLFAQSKMSSITSRMIVKPAFCYSSKEDLPLRIEPPYYLYLGEFSDEKGLPVLLEAFADNKLPVKVAGSGHLKRLVVGYSEFYPNIVPTEIRTPAERSMLLENATALIFPAVWYETFGCVITEAFSKGIPVIATDRGNLKEMVSPGYNGLLFEADNDKDLRAKIDQLETLEEPERNNYSKNAVCTYKNKYTPEKNAETLIALYQSLCLPVSRSPVVGKQYWGDPQYR